MSLTLGGSAGASVLSAVAAGLAVLLWLRRPTGRPRPAPPPAWRAAVGACWRGRPDAPPLKLRLLVVGAVVVMAVCWAPAAVPRLWLVALGPPVVLAGVLVLGRFEPAAARRRRLRLVLDLPLTLDLLGAGLAAGRPLRAAVADVVAVTEGPLAADLGAVVAAVALGRPEAEAWNELRGHPVLGAVAVDLARSVASGTRLAEVLSVHARVARRRRQSQLEALSKAVGVRCVVPLMVCFLPAFLLIGVVPIITSVLLASLR